MKIFLDIDGVMVHADPSKRVEIDNDGFYKFNLSAIEALNAICQYYQRKEIILSTSHRFRFSIIEWKSIFLRRGFSFDNITIMDYPTSEKISRKVEIENWIKLNRLKSNQVVIIDDDKSLNGLSIEYKRRLLLTNPYTGLDFKIIKNSSIRIRKKA